MPAVCQRCWGAPYDGRMRPPTGDQYTLRFGESEAVITQVAAGIRVFRSGGVDVTEPFDIASPTPSANGIVLVPWPNRVRDGSWMGEGERQQLALTEPALRNASHGLLRFHPYTLVSVTSSSVCQSALIVPQTGYPFLLQTRVTHILDERGLTVVHTVINEGTTAAPVAIGAHPYLRIGDVPSDQLTLTVQTLTRFETDERKNVTDEVPVAGTPYDLSRGVRVSDLVLDTGFSVPAAAEHVLSADDGRRVVLWTDASYEFVQLFTHRSFAGRTSGVPALAIEPMTAPGDALNTGRGLTWLQPDDVWTVRWGIRPEF